MISLKDALKLSAADLAALKTDIAKCAAASKLGAYIEPLINQPLSSCDGDFGVPIAIKDNIQVAGWAITNASRIMQGYVAPYDATVITRLRANGMAPFGRTNMDEFAMGNSTASSFYGRTLNPLDPERIPGGSSGGSAAAVAAGLAVASLGSDTGGSVRQPAAFCGCVGFKPSYGRVSRYGLASYSSSLDQIGTLTRSVEDAALLYNAIAGPDERDSTSSPREFEPVAIDSAARYKIAYVKNYADACAPDIRAALERARDALAAAGHSICEVELPQSKYDVAAYYLIACAEASANLSRYDGVRYGRRAENPASLGELYAASRSEGFGAEVQRRIMLGTFVLSSGYIDAYYKKAQAVRELICEQYARIFEGADLILMPVAPSHARKFSESVTSLQSYLEDIFTVPINLARLAGISVPVAGAGVGAAARGAAGGGAVAGGLNISAQLVAPRFGEQQLLNCAASLEAAMAE